MSYQMEKTAMQRTSLHSSFYLKLYRLQCQACALCYNIIEAVY